MVLWLDINHSNTLNLFLSTKWLVGKENSPFTSAPWCQSSLTTTFSLCLTSLRLRTYSGPGQLPIQQPLRIR